MSLEDELAKLTGGEMPPPAEPEGTLALAVLFGNYRKYLLWQGFTADEAFELVRDYHEAVLAAQLARGDEDE